MRVLFLKLIKSFEQHESLHSLTSRKTRRSATHYETKRTFRNDNMLVDVLFGVI